MSRGTDAFDPDLGLKVAHKRCDQCLFSSGKIVDDERRDEVLENCRKTGRYFICHKATKRRDAVVCRGFFDTEPNQACRMATALRLVIFVDPSTGKPSK